MNRLLVPVFFVAAAMRLVGCSHHDSHGRAHAKSKSTRTAAKTATAEDRDAKGSTYFDHEDFETRQPANQPQSALPREPGPERQGVSTESANKVDGSGTIQPGPDKEHFEKLEVGDKK